VSLLAAYGTLMTGQVNGVPETIRACLRSAGLCSIPGRMYRIWQNGIDYPALVPADDDATVAGELFHLGDDPASVLAAMDVWEDCWPDDPARSAYVRRQVDVAGDTPATGVWVYFYNRPIEGLEPIQDGRWIPRQADRKARAVF
jgi:gamma-glutamylcyclotransferase (GGCT)/AIG2-like uncharacterized protein YtfP